MKNLVFVVVFFSSISSLTWAAPQFDQQLFDFVEDIREKRQNAGLAIGIINQQGLSKYSLHGVADVETGETPSLDSLFMIGSTTKAFTATAVGVLQDEGLMSFETPVRELLPQFQLSYEVVASQVTIRDLLLHRVGIPRYDFFWLGHEIQHENFYQFLPKMQFLTPFRQAWNYNNWMYAAAGHAAGAAVDSSYSELLQSRLLAPLQMNGTRVIVDDLLDTDLIAQPHEVAEGGSFQKIEIRDINAMAPAGSIHSNMNDLSNWVQMLLNGGEFNGRQVVGSQTLADILNPQIVVQSPESGTAVDYSLGWMHYEFGGVRLIAHGGGIDGYLTQIAFIPSMNTGIVVLTNGGNLNPEHVMLTVLNEYLQENEKIDLFPEIPEPELRDRDYIEKVSNFAKVYENETWGKMTVTVGTLKDGRAGLNFRSNSFDMGTVGVFWSDDKSRVLADMPTPFKFVFEAKENQCCYILKANLEPALPSAVFE